jgi:hypothetical protein
MRSLSQWRLKSSSPFSNRVTSQPAPIPALFLNSQNCTFKLQGRTRYDLLVTAVARAVDEADPIGLLAMGSPADEYSLEIDTIVPRVSKAFGPGEVRRIVHEEFVRWFDAGIAGPEEAYESLAQRVWEAVIQFQAG